MDPYRTYFVAALFATVAVVNGQDIFYQGRRLDFSGGERPYFKGRTVMVPVRTMASRTGILLESASGGRRANMFWQKNSGSYVKGESQMTLNGRRFNIGAPSDDRDGVFYVSATIFQLMTNNRVTIGSSGDGWGGGSNNGGWGGGNNGGWGNGNDNGWGDNSGTVYYEGRPVTFDGDEAPIRAGNSLLVPVRKMTDVIHGSIRRTEDGKRMWITVFDQEATYDKERNWYRIGLREIRLPNSSRERNGVLFIPIEIFRDLTRGQISWRM
jgi:hypothetical protein